MTISELLKQIRTELNMSQNELAQAICVTSTTVSRWENNKSTPNNMARTVLADYCKKQGISENLVAAIKMKPNRK